MSQNKKETSIILKNLTISKNDKYLLTNLSFNLLKNSIISIVGGDEKYNQAIIEIVLGYLEKNSKIVSGDLIIKIDSEYANIFNLEQNKIENFRKKNVSILYKESNSIFIEVEKIGKYIIDIILEKTNKNKNKIKEEIKNYMIFFDIPLKLLNKYPNQIKDSRKKMLAFIMAIIIEPNILILDEPFSSDIITRNRMISIINRYKKDMAILILTDDILLLELEDFVTHTLVVENNEIILKGSPTDILKSDNLIIKQFFKEARFIF